MRPLRSVPLVLAGVASVGVASAGAQGVPRTLSIGPYTPPAPASKACEDPPPRIAQYGVIAKPISLRPAAVDARAQLDAMDAWNRAGNEPRHAGFTRSLPESIAARLGSAFRDTDPDSVRARSAAGVTLWGTKVTVGEAYGIRLHLTGVDLPPGTRFWSYGTEGNPVSFGLELRGPDGDLWTPITFGETAFLDVEVPSSGADGGLTIRELAEIRPLAAAGTEPPCAIDAACVTAATFPAIAEARKAVALVQFMVGNEPASCTGTLLNDTAQDGTPYLWTAHHCISTQAGASSVQAFWDYDAPSCGGMVPALSSLKSSVGATLLATGTFTDFCLMQLSSVPSDRSFMGWDARPSSVAVGTTVYRVSHPASYIDPEASPLPQEFSNSLLTSDAACPFGLEQAYLFTNLESGYVYYGSSGSAALLSGGQLVGQLKGSCQAPGNICLASPQNFDGEFAVTYPFVARWLDAPSPTCAQDPTTLCVNTRFQVTAQWNKADGSSGNGTAVSLTPDSGYFWFFDPSNIEIVTKVVSGCGINAHYWVFSAGLTNTGVTLTLTDLASGIQKAYRSAAGKAFEPIQDTSAFATCP